MRLTSSSRSGGIINKLVFSAFGLIFVFFGFLFIKQGLTSQKEIQSMQEWVAVPCTIKTSAVKDHGEDFRLEVTYEYHFNGKKYTGSRYGQREYYTAETITKIKSAEKRMKPEKVIDGYCNPKAPMEAVLHRPTPESARSGLLFSLIFPAVGVLFAVLPWLGFLFKRKKSTIREKPVLGKNTRGSRIFLACFGAVFLLVGLVLVKPVLITPFQKIQDAKTWNEVPAVVVSSKVKSHKGDDSTTYSPYIAYRYEVDFREYFGDQYTLTDGSSSGYEGKAKIVRQYPKGHTFSVFVNPANPSESVINRDAKAGLLFGLIPLIFAGVGFVIIIFSFKYSESKKLDPGQAAEHVVTLKGKSPVGKLIGISLFSIIWNGVVVLIFKVNAPLLFGTIFGLVGIGTIAGVIHGLLACFNPRPVAELTPGNLSPGSKGALRWRMHGNTERIQTLEITLRCLHVTTETRRSGSETKTSVEKRPIFTKQLTRTTDQHEIAHGVLEFQIEEDQPASRRSNTDGIEWQFLFLGDIPKWPDIKNEFKFLVYPPKNPK